MLPRPLNYLLAVVTGRIRKSNASTPTFKEYIDKLEETDVLRESLFASMLLVDWYFSPMDGYAKKNIPAAAEDWRKLYTMLVPGFLALRSVYSGGRFELAPVYEELINKIPECGDYCPSLALAVRETRSNESTKPSITALDDALWNHFCGIVHIDHLSIPDEMVFTIAIRRCASAAHDSCPPRRNLI